MKIKLQTKNLEKLTKFLRKNQVKKLIRASLVGAFLFWVISLTTFYLAYRNKIFPGVSVTGYPIGNQTLTQAIQLLEKQKNQLNQNASLSLLYQGQGWEINLEKIGFQYQSAQTAQKAFEIGRSGKPLENLQEQAQAWFSGIQIDWEYQLNQSLLEAQIATIAAEIFIPPIEPEIEISGQGINITLGQEGLELDRRNLWSLLGSRFAWGNFTPLELPTIHLSSRLSEYQAEKTRQRAEKFLGQKLTFSFGEEQWNLEENQLVNLLSFADGSNEEKIASQAADLASVINRPAENAAFQFENNRVTEFRPAQDGYALNEEETIALVKKALTEIEEKSEPKTINLPVESISPEITTDQVNDLGIKSLLGKGVSYFWGSIPSRIHNIVLASSRLNGILIRPGEDFSFLKALGEVSPATGYQSAFVIKEGKTVLDDGGGVCQVSTTFFRAALNAGLPILERHPHSYRVSYYEQGGFGPGLDATVWIPSVDLKIKNDTPAHILIQTKADTATKTLTFEFYGTSDNRQVSLSKPKIWSQTAPPPDLYQDDPTLPAGTIKQIERANWGAKVSVDWRVTHGLETLQERTFYSQYQPWQAVFLRGTGP